MFAASHFGIAELDPVHQLVLLTDDGHYEAGLVVATVVVLLIWLLYFLRRI